MSDKRRRLEAAFEQLALGSGHADDRIIAKVRAHTDVNQAVVRREIQALRLFSIESGIDLAVQDVPGVRDQLTAALYSPMVKAVRETDDPQASIDFAQFKAGVEVYRGSLQDCEQAMITPQDLVQRVGQQFAKLCGAPDSELEQIGLSIFVDTCKRSKRAAEDFIRE